MVVRLVRLRQVVFDVGNLHVLAVLVVDAQLQHQRPHVILQLTLGHLLHHLAAEEKHQSSIICKDRRGREGNYTALRAYFKFIPSKYEMY